MVALKKVFIIINIKTRLTERAIILFVFLQMKRMKMMLKEDSTPTLMTTSKWGHPEKPRRAHPRNGMKRRTLSSGLKNTSRSQRTIRFQSSILTRNWKQPNLKLAKCNNFLFQSLFKKLFLTWWSYPKSKVLEYISLFTNNIHCWTPMSYDDSFDVWY